ncbi:MAG: hypothetical protein U0892_04570 [Pirellulales bacterium]
METSVQPILCCIGDEVAGEPTQFLMERAFAAARLDWHVITVQVPADELTVAVAGIRAMRFSALRFLRSFQRTGPHELGATDDSLAYIGKATSAMRCGDLWIAWHNWGRGLIETLRESLPLDQCLIWSIGDSPEVRSALVAAAESPPAAWLRTGQINSDRPPDIALPATEEPIPESPTGMITILSERISQLGGSQRSLIYVGEADSATLDVLAAAQPDQDCGLVLVSDLPGSRRKLSEHWKCGPTRVISRSDLAVAAEAYDFRRWTERAPALETMRDAYEEYTDF